MNTGEDPNRLSSVQSVQEEMADTSAREPCDLGLALALVRCADSDLVGTKGEERSFMSFFISLQFLTFII